MRAQSDKVSSPDLSLQKTVSCGVPGLCADRTAVREHPVGSIELNVTRGLPMRPGAPAASPVASGPKAGMAAGLRLSVIPGAAPGPRDSVRIHLTSHETGEPVIRDSLACPAIYEAM